MALVVFLRGVNVGGSKAFRPSVLAREMAKFDVVNIGAAGTLVVRAKISQTALRTEFENRLPFKTELILCREREILDLFHRNPFRKVPPETKDLRHYLTVMTKAPRPPPPLPLDKPAGNKWEVHIFEILGRFALSVWRRQSDGILYPNAVVEKHFLVPATTRNWNTISAICEVLKT